jgi:hypothetical protein
MILVVITSTYIHAKQKGHEKVGQGRSRFTFTDLASTRSNNRTDNDEEELPCSQENPWRREAVLCEPLRNESYSKDLNEYLTYFLMFINLSIQTVQSTT